MQATSNFLHQVPSYVQTSWQKMKPLPAAARNWIVEHLNHPKQYAAQFWNKEAKPLYDRTFRVLSYKDYLVFTGAVITAALLTYVALNALGIVMIALVFPADAAIILGGAAYLRYRIHKHFDHIAWDQVEQIRQIGYTITPKNQVFEQIKEIQGNLNNPEFKHLNADNVKLRESLKECIDKFERLIKNPEQREFKDGKATFIREIEAILNTLFKFKKFEELKVKDPLDITAYDKPLIQPPEDNGLNIEVKEEEDSQPKLEVDIREEQEKDENPFVEVTEESQFQNPNFAIEED